MIEDIVAKIKEQYDSVDVVTKLDEEILNWVDDDWEDEHDNEYDWYSSYGRGEAEGAILEEMIATYNNQHNKGKELDFDTHCRVYERLQEEFPDLNYF